MYIYIHTVYIYIYVCLLRGCMRIREMKKQLEDLDGEAWLQALVEVILASQIICAAELCYCLPTELS